MKKYNRALSVHGTAMPLGLSLGHSIATRSFEPRRVTSPRGINTTDLRLSSGGWNG